MSKMRLNLPRAGPKNCTFLLSPEGQQALVDLHVDGIISHLDSLCCGSRRRTLCSPTAGQPGWKRLPIFV